MFSCATLKLVETIYRVDFGYPSKLVVCIHLNTKMVHVKGGYLCPDAIFLLILFADRDKN